MQKELAVAFIWHMHQPNYQTQPNGIRLMPWARLHAIKDYLDMLIILDKFPKIKLNFSLSPDLIDAIEDYANNDGHDIHSKLTITPINQLTNDDKLYILNYFFEANYENLISKNPRYNELYHKRFGCEEISIDDFSNQEYADIMALFNLVWFDPIWINVYPELKSLIKKGKNYTIADRIKIIDLNRKIIKQIIPAYKKYQDEGRIEIITSPYNHPILPILIDQDDLKIPSLKYPMPDCKTDFSDDAKEQILLGIQKTKEVFGITPKGFWPSEHFISQKTLDMLTSLGIEWVVTDESVLSNSIDKHFVRDFRGCYEDPYEVCSLYSYKAQNKKINMLFRNSVIANLIGFEYAHRDSVLSANDLFDRIKTIYDKLKKSPDDKHILTIAMDGENSWDAYPNDGEVFLERIYNLINDDSNLETVLVSDYIKKNKKTEKNIKKITTGSWFNQEFQLWIAEPTKNLAWQYLAKTREDVYNAIKTKKLTKKQIAAAKSEIYIAEGSDWFWWYGEPNNSDQDNIFDFLFREHLKNVYRIIQMPIPENLDMPLISYMGKPLRNPKKQIKPNINGFIKNNKEWLSAGCIDVPTGPILKETKLLNRIFFGSDTDNLYIRFDTNSYLMDSNNSFKEYFSIYVYIKSYNSSLTATSPIRTTNKSEKFSPVLIDGYTHEIKYALTPNRKYPFQFSTSVKDGLWELKWDHNIKYAHNEILETAIPYEDLGINPGDNFDFFIITGCSGVAEEIYPKDVPISLKRPFNK